MESKSTDRFFSILEKKDHINVLDLKAVLFRLRSLAKDLRSAHIKVLCDNSTAVAVAFSINLAPADLSNVILLPKKYGLGQLKPIFGFLPPICQGYKILRLIWNLANKKFPQNGNLRIPSSSSYVENRIFHQI